MQGCHPGRQGSSGWDEEGGALPGVWVCVGMWGDVGSFLRTPQRSGVNSVTMGWNGWAAWRFRASQRYKRTCPASAATVEFRMGVSKKLRIDISHISHILVWGVPFWRQILLEAASETCL